MMNQLSFHWNWWFIWKKIIFSMEIKEHFNQNWWFRFISLIIQLNSSSWKESIRWKNEIHQLKFSIQDKQTFIQNNQIEKNQLFSIEFIHSQIVDFIIFITLKQNIWWNSVNWLFLNNFGQKEKFLSFWLFSEVKKEKNEKYFCVFQIVIIG